MRAGTYRSNGKIEVFMNKINSTGIVQKYVKTKIVLKILGLSLLVTTFAQAMNYKPIEYYGFLSAVQHGKYEEVKRLLARYDSLKNEQDRDGDSALMLAVREGHAQIVKLLLDAGANVNHGNNEGRTALMYASKYAYRDKDLTILPMLIARGADVNQANKFGGTPLSGAVCNGRKAYVEKLIEAKANVNHRDPRGITPLIDAAMNGECEIAQTLIDAKADVHLVVNMGSQDDRDDRTALSIASKAKYQELSELLLKEIVRERVNILKAGIQALLIYLKSKAKALGNESGAPEIYKNAKVLFYPFFQESIEDIYLEEIIKVENTKMQEAFGAKYLPIFANKYKQFLRAVCTGDEQTVKELLATIPVDLNINQRGSTPLMFAAQNGKETIVKILLDANANPNLRNAYSESALDFAQGSGHTDIAQILKEAKKK